MVCIYAATWNIINGQTHQYSPSYLNQYYWKTTPGAVDIVGESDPAAAVEVNSIPATQQGKYFHGQVAVSNSSSPQYEHITVTADDGTSVATHEGDAFVPAYNVSFTYDADGNLTTDGRWDYTWDGENRLIKMETISAVPPAAKRKMQFGYDFMGRRVWKTSQAWDNAASDWAAPQSQFFCYDGWNLVSIVDGASYQATDRFTWGTDLSGTMQGAGGVGGLLSVSKKQSGGAWQNSYAIPDANGNVMKLADVQSLDTVAEYEYGPFGELIRMTGPRAKANPFRFSSKYQDEESGLLYYGFRYYDPAMGRWISRDPIGEVGGINLYGLLSNKPNSRIDFLGLSDRNDIPDRLQYTCNCGWIDWGHAQPGGAMSLTSQVRTEAGLKSLTGNGYKVIYGQKMSKWQIELGVLYEWYVPYGLSGPEKDGVSLSIFKFVSEEFEKFQWPLSSSFSEEDLVSNLIGFYRAAKGYSKEDVIRWCKPVSDAESFAIFDRDGLGKNHSWYPKFHHSCECESPKFPIQFQTIKESNRYRKWTYFGNPKDEEHIPDYGPTD